jgi:hypothetical protein
MYVQFAMLCHKASLWWSADLAYITWLASAFENERHVWSESRYRALVRLQACVRGYLFRKNVLWSPHTEIGHRFLEAHFSKEVATASA